MTYSTTVSARDGSGEFAVYVAEPAGTPRAAIVVVQEIFGVNAGIRRKCDLLAQEGYLALAPDLFWRLEPGLQLDADNQASMAKGVELVIRFDTDVGVTDIQATIDHARTLSGGLKVGIVGYCLGGRMAAYAAARTDADASVGYYGVMIEHMLGERDSIRNPLMLHIPEHDDHVPADIQARIHAALDGHPCVTIHDYPGEHHGFADTFGIRRSPAAADLADQRTREFFGSKLG
ncbi:dienelactone hydrolase family protein [Sphingobium nicotianae]|uniref:Dienelactone hydrolase family protein n=1 Tax=Sphingobium nicotianae TaxID=2782607 RepID=A0A9X1DED0_9SPHN|nr:dienelactone hydrolase family protein [Sphingobium nicotianae]MBT2188642.1 dienelactone hydrolase family protein [Sphingobium nicotianae]